MIHKMVCLIDRLNGGEMQQDHNPSKHTFLTASITDFDDKGYFGNFIFPGPVTFTYCLGLEKSAKETVKELKGKTPVQIADYICKLDFGLHDAFMNYIEIDGETDLQLFNIALTGAYSLEECDKESSSCLFEMRLTPKFKNILNKYLNSR